MEFIPKKRLKTILKLLKVYYLGSIRDYTEYLIEK